MFRNHKIRWGLLGLIAVLIAAAPRQGVDDLIREANAAVASKDYATAVALYEMAEPRALDPGLVAYNKGVALYQQALAANLRDTLLRQLNDNKGVALYQQDLAAQTASEKQQYFRKAELAYRCAAEGAGEPRLLRARFGLANSLVQGRADKQSALKESIAIYHDCLQSPSLDPMMAEDVRRNLEIAKLILLRLQTQAQKPDKKPEDGGDNPPKPDPKKPDPEKPMIGDDPMKDGGTQRPTDRPGEVKKDGKNPRETDVKTAGKGNINTIYDPAQSPPLNASEAEEELEKAIQRILEEQRGKRYRSSRTPAGTVKDW